MANDQCLTPNDPMALGGDVDRHHALSLSDDAGETWSTPTLVDALTGPTCEGSVARLADGTLPLSNPSPNSKPNPLPGPIPTPTPNQARCCYLLRRTCTGATPRTGAT